MLVSRRGVLAGLGAVLAAPAIVHAGNLMPVRSIERLTIEPSRLLRIIDPSGRVICETPVKRVDGELSFPLSSYVGMFNGFYVICR